LSQYCKASLFFFANFYVWGGGAPTVRFAPVVPWAKAGPVYRVELRKQMVYLFSFTLYGETTIFRKELKYEYLTVLLYACETWKTTNQITRKLQTFVNKRLRRIINIKVV
jgi:hypothetical protein